MKKNDLVLPGRISWNRALLWLMLFVWMAMIFNMSAMDAQRSHKLSEGVTRIGLEMFVPAYGHLSEGRQSELLEKTEGNIRKLAHFLEYVFLGVLAARTFMPELPGICRAYRGKGMNFGGRRMVRDARKAIVIFALCNLLFCTVYALSDEFHQMFILGRSPQALDVCIDTGGSSIGIVIILIIQVCKNKQALKKVSK